MRNQSAIGLLIAIVLLAGTYCSPDRRFLQYRRPLGAFQPILGPGYAPQPCARLALNERIFLPLIIRTNGELK